MVKDTGSPELILKPKPYIKGEAKELHRPRGGSGRGVEEHGVLGVATGRNKGQEGTHTRDGPQQHHRMPRSGAATMARGSAMVRTDTRGRDAGGPPMKHKSTKRGLRAA